MQLSYIDKGTKKLRFITIRPHVVLRKRKLTYRQPSFGDQSHEAILHEKTKKSSVVMRSSSHSYKGSTLVDVQVKI